jgi:hypothetical protein
VPDRAGAAGSSAGGDSPHRGRGGGATPGGWDLDDSMAGAVATVAAVFPDGWRPLEDDPPGEDDWWEREQDPGSDLTPAQIDALVARLPAEWQDDPELDGDDGSPDAAGVLGLMPRHLAGGGGFDAGGVVDQLPPGVVLAKLADNAWQTGLRPMNDDELVGLALAWRRLNSWAAAGELAAVAELGRRRRIEAEATGDPRVVEHFADELAMAMTLTGRAADALLELAEAMARLPRTRAALAAGDIDRAKASVIADELSVLTGPQAAEVEAGVLDKASRQTTSQLRAAAKRAALAVDPAAAKKRREKAQKNARVEVWHEPSGTASLAGRDLPPAEVLAADQRINALARRLKAARREGTLDQLRAEVYTALLLGRPLDDPRAAPPAPGTTPDPGGAAPSDDSSPRGTGTGGEPGSARPESLRGSVNLTMPLSAWLGASDAPGEAAGFGAIPADDARAMAKLLAARPGNRWCLTLTGRNGRAVAHGCTTVGDPGGSRTRPGSTGPPGAPTDAGAPSVFTITISPLAVKTCSHEREGPGYRPSDALRHALHVRQRTCSAPGCRRAAERCDLDHTKPYAQGGRTCECGMAPLCRRHHRAKQAQGWRLEQPAPGELIWRLPHGRTYRVEPDPYLE